MQFGNRVQQCTCVYPKKCNHRRDKEEEYSSHNTVFRTYGSGLGWVRTTGRFELLNTVIERKTQIQCSLNPLWTVWNVRKLPRGFEKPCCDCTQEVVSCRVEVHLKVLKLIFGELTPNEMSRFLVCVSLYRIVSVI